MMTAQSTCQQPTQGFRNHTDILKPPLEKANPHKHQDGMDEYRGGDKRQHVCDHLLEGIDLIQVNPSHC
jgi:hypothetical protein